MNKILLVLIVLVIAISSATISFAIDINSLCIDAIHNGNLTGNISGSTGHVDNKAEMSFPVGLAVYKKFDNIIDNQEIFDFDTGVVAADGLTDLKVDLPNCAYQIDLFCGDVLLSLNGTRYGDRKLDFKHVGGDNFCTHDHQVPEFTAIGGGIALLGAAGYALYRRRNIK